MNLLTRGNAKLGNDIWTYSHSPIVGCGEAATEACAKFCYAAQLARRRQKVGDGWARRLGITQDTERFKEMLLGDLANLPSGTVVRLHVSGDFWSAEYARAWLSVMRRHPDITFFGYTRAWRVPDIRRMLNRMRRLSNVRLWASTDSDTGPAPRGWHTADYLYRPEDATGQVICPEQVGTRADCSSCGLCWHVRTDRPVRLAFINHDVLRARRRVGRPVRTADTRNDTTRVPRR